MLIAIASDHGGFALKEKIKEYLRQRGDKIVDLGTTSEESVDYPIYGKACAEAVASGKAERGIVCCGTGIGISIAANKVKGIRCGLCTSVEMARLNRASRTRCRMSGRPCTFASISSKRRCHRTSSDGVRYASHRPWKNLWRS